MAVAPAEGADSVRKRTDGAGAPWKPLAMWRWVAGVLVAAVLAAKIAVSGPAFDRFRAAYRAEGATLAGAVHCAFGNLSKRERAWCNEPVARLVAREP